MTQNKYRINIILLYNNMFDLFNRLSDQSIPGYSRYIEVVCWSSDQKCSCRYNIYWSVSGLSANIFNLLIFSISRFHQKLLAILFTKLTQMFIILKNCIRPPPSKMATITLKQRLHQMSIINTFYEQKVIYNQLSILSLSDKAYFYNNFF